MITQHEVFRRRSGFTVTGLARNVPCDHAYASRVEAGEIRASERYQLKVAQLLGVRRDVLFDQATGRAV